MTINMNETEARPCIFTRACRVAPFLGALAIALLGVTVVSINGAKAAEGAPIQKLTWGFEAPFGTFDRSALRRGYKVYTEVCAACHSMDLMRFRNLSQEGGPEFTEDEVKVIAAEHTVEDGPDDYGDMFDRPGIAADPFPAPFANDNAARA